MEEFEGSDAPSPATLASLAIENPELSVNDLKQFINDFVQKLQIFDPMDRSIPQK